MSLQFNKKFTREKVKGNSNMLRKDCISQLPTYLKATAWNSNKIKVEGIKKYFENMMNQP